MTENILNFNDPDQHYRNSESQSLLLISYNINARPAIIKPNEICRLELEDLVEVGEGEVDDPELVALIAPTELVTAPAVEGPTLAPIHIQLEINQN